MLKFVNILRKQLEIHSNLINLNRQQHILTIEEESMLPGEKGTFYL